MKITYLKLVNAASLYTGTNASEVEIDLSESYNRIVLIGGPNGCGKTSLLSCLHPFAYNGTLDDRSSEPLILAGKDGYKEIHIQYSSDEFLIKHFYVPSGQSHSVKSYIMKNGVELNPNGNVTSFKEIVSLELDLEMDFLKLIRLGSNVVNLMDMSPTERKNYMGNLLDEAEIYLQYHKKVSADMKAMKTIIARDSDKLSRLGVTDIEREESYLEEMRNVTLKKFQTMFDELRQKQTVLQYELDTNSSSTQLKDKIQNILSRISEIERRLDGKKFKSINDDDTSEQTVAKLIKFKSELEASSTTKTMLLDTIDECHTELEDLSIKRKKLENNEERQSCQNIIRQLKDDIEKLETQFRGFKATYTSEDITEMLDVLEKLQTQLSTIYEVGDKPVKKVISLMRNGSRVPDYIDKKRFNLQNNKIEASASDVMSILKGKLKQIKISKVSCSEKCPYRDIYEELVAMSDIKKDDDVESDDFYTYMQIAYTNISSALDTMQKNVELFMRMPAYIQSMFILDTIFDHIEKREWIYDPALINNAMTSITDYERLQKMKDDLKSHQITLDKLEDNTGLEFVIDRISTVYRKIQDSEKELSATNCDISNLSEEVDHLEHAAELRKEKESLTTELEELKKEYSKLKELQVTLAQYQEELYSISIGLNKCGESIRRTNDDIKMLERRIDEYHFLMKDLQKVKRDYDDWELARTSLSGKEGMPLIHIDVYLKKTRKIVNELLDIVYGGGLRIDKFDITADTFRIPYLKNDRMISDVKLASQGESSFITIALSFALSMQSISRYNIMLLDEIDSTLDETNREKFITILEKMMDMVNTEQIFLISHNNMFDMYPVDYLDMSQIKKSQVTRPVATH